MEYSLKILKEHLNKAISDYDWYHKESCGLPKEMKEAHIIEYQSIIEDLQKSINKLEE